MQNTDQFLRLYNELTALKKSIAGTIEYKKFRFTYEDILGLLDDKIIHVYLKYEGTHDYEEIKALAISSLYNMRARIYRDYSTEYPIEGDIELIDEPYEEKPSIDILFKSLSKFLSNSQLKIAKIILSPPAYVMERINSLDVRIPSHLYLEFLGIPTTKPNVKWFNRIRRELRDIIRKRIDPVTFELRVT